jgi:hypothetical protein
MVRLLTAFELAQAFAPATASLKHTAGSDFHESRKECKINSARIVCAVCVLFLCRSRFRELVNMCFSGVKLCCIAVISWQLQHAQR